MKTYNKYGGKSFFDIETVRTQYIPKGTKYEKRYISVPDFVNVELSKLKNASEFLTMLVIEKLNIQKPITDEERKRMDEEMREFE